MIPVLKQDLDYFFVISKPLSSDNLHRLNSLNCSISSSHAFITSYKGSITSYKGLMTRIYYSKTVQSGPSSFF